MIFNFTQTTWFYPAFSIEQRWKMQLTACGRIFFVLQAAKDVSQALNNCVNYLPGQRDVDEAIKAVVTSSQSLAIEDVS